MLPRKENCWKSTLKVSNRPTLVVLPVIPVSTWEAEQKNHEFKISLDQIKTPYLKNQQHEEISNGQVHSGHLWNYE
jgi:hypothetical protein